jgi:hypothetical protein
MFYAIRDPQGNIQSVSNQATLGGEAVNDDHPDLLRFLGGDKKGPNFSEADAEFVRVLEDLIDTLITNNVIRHTDLPAAAQQKLVTRKGLRNRMQDALNLLDGDERII